VIDVGEWLASRSPEPPSDLSERIVRIVGGKTCADEAAMAELFIRSAAELLGTLRDDRTGAFDLLAADALITYAMEASANKEENLETAARLAMQVIGAVPGPGGQA